MSDTPGPACRRPSRASLLHMDGEFGLVAAEVFVGAAHLLARSAHAQHRLDAPQPIEIALLDFLYR
jgi:hypothetical protein